MSHLSDKERDFVARVLERDASARENINSIIEKPCIDALRTAAAIIKLDCDYVRLRDAFACVMNLLEDEEGNLPDNIPQETRDWLNEVDKESTDKADEMTRMLK